MTEIEEAVAPSGKNGDVAQLYRALLDLTQEENRLTGNLICLAERRNQLAQARTELTREQFELSRQLNEMAERRNIAADKRTVLSEERTRLAKD